jgi:hypothetical protein
MSNKGMKRKLAKGYKIPKKAPIVSESDDEEQAQVEGLDTESESEM